MTDQRLAVLTDCVAQLGPVVGYVSDERYLAVPGVYLEIGGADGRRYAVTSTATGAVCVDLPDGTYDVALNLPGYGAKRSALTVPSAKPHHFRLLKDQLLGYVWPMYTTAGGAGEFRCHSAVAYKLSLWRYGERKAHRCASCCVREPHAAFFLGKMIGFNKTS
jgi:hypothetical protein